MKDFTLDSVSHLCVECSSVVSIMVDFPDGSPESMVYLALKVDLDTWYMIKAYLISKGLIRCAFDQVFPTDKTQACSDAIDGVIAKVRAKELTREDGRQALMDVMAFA